MDMEYLQQETIILQEDVEKEPTRESYTWEKI